MNIQNERQPLRFRADSMAFFDRPGLPPIFTRKPQLDLAHLTSVPPLKHFLTDFDAAFDAHCAFKKIALANPGVHEIRTSEDLHVENSMGILFGMQHTPDGLEDRIGRRKQAMERCQKLFDAGIRVMAISYQDANDYGSGFAAEGGLTLGGIEWLQCMAACGMILDVSHLNHETASNALDYIKDTKLRIKVMASHSACSTTYPHKRNISDDIMKRIGYLGIPALSFFLAEEGRPDYMKEFSRHVLHAVSVMGIEKVGIGSDCPHLNMTPEAARENFNRMTSMLQTHGSLGEFFPDRPWDIILGGSFMVEMLGNRVLQDASAKIDEELRQNVCGMNFGSFLAYALPQQ